MCGICGIYNLDQKPVNTNKLEQMTRLLKHRGPSDEGYLLWNTPKNRSLHCYGIDTMEEIKARTTPLQNSISANLGFGFRRLSIIDLSARGHQPMSSADGKIWIVFNGEIYNYIELRSELQNLGFNFTTSSDTEVLLKAYQAWGEDCLPKLNGMWAFCLWDSRKQKLFCARDRYGIKPFNYFFNGKTFLFSSEIKSLLIHDLDKSLNEEMIYRSLKLNSFLIHTDNTFFKKIKLLPHSHYLVIQNQKLSLRRYYDLDSQTFETSDLSFDEAKEQYRKLFIDSVKLRMRSDVEVGSTLSGGLDSSAIVCTAANLTDQQFQSFSAYYTHDPRYDERKWIKLVAEQNNIKDHYISTQSDQALEDFHRIIFYMDYPVIGSSYISQYYVMKLAREHGVTVLLDGQGSDEITAGYNHSFYRYYADLLKQFKILKFLKEFPVYLRLHQKGTLPEKIAKTLITLFLKESSIYREEGKRAFPNPLNRQFADNKLYESVRDLPTSKLSNFLYNLLMNTMLQTLLHYEDRNSMAFSIESRVPFLDYRLVEFAFTLPSEFKIHEHIGKLIHREALRPLVPQEIINRKDKVSFFSPGEFFWLKNEYRSYAQSVFTSNKFKSREIFDVNRINSLYQKYLNGDTRLGTLLWKVFALEHWFRVFVDQSPSQWESY
ncbi:MAG: asparagine synthase (glutamine-hydrolyzing) [Calditrichaeota bacterium]|nr:asparagine synthase (glutamine-hydrolyzing) [Calditrichota bacterium]